MTLLIDRGAAERDYFSRMLVPGVRLEKSAHSVQLLFATAREILSSCVLGGGRRQVKQLVNVRVREQDNYPYSPAETLVHYCREHQLTGASAGMMTAASMNSLRVAQACEQGLQLIVLVTAGLSNARCAGDSAEQQTLAAHGLPPGTINTVLLFSHSLSEAAMAEALIVATEAKVVALRELAVRSPVSNKLATGTGTDALAVVAGTQQPELAYCGKHLLAGEMLARLVIEATVDSLRFEVEGR